MNRKKRQEVRAARYRGLAEKAQARSTTAQSKANSIGSMIPMGQPILVGHHSESRHRKDIKKIDKAMEQSLNETKKAAYFQQKAIAIENNTAIYSNDDDAIERLKEKLAKKEKLQETMKKANAAIRKGDDSALKALGMNDIQIEELKKPDYCGRIGFAAYQLQNNNAEIRRIKIRIKEVSTIQSRPEIQVEVGQTEIRENAEFGSVEIKFPSKPDQNIIDELKSKGWRWARTSGVWYFRRRGDDVLAMAKEIAARSI
jgi:hypothetical protein